MTRPTRYGRLWATFWTDERVSTLDEGSTLAAAYILAGRQQNLIGCASFSVGMAAEDCKTSPQTFAERFANLRDLFGWHYDSARVLFVPGWWPWHLPDNPNILKGWLRDVEGVPKGESLSLFFATGSDLPPNLRETFRETLSRTFGEGFDAQPETFSLRRRLRRREEEEEKLGDPVPGNRPSKAPAVDPGLSLVSFPVRPSGSWDLTEALADELAKKWQVDRAFVVEAAKNAEKFIRRPGQDNRKTARGMLRFLSDQVGRRIDFKGAPSGGGAKGRGTDFVAAGETADVLAGLFDEPVGRGEA